MRRAALRQEWPGLALLGCALVFWGVALVDEVRIGRVPLNDSVELMYPTDKVPPSASGLPQWKRSLPGSVGE